MFELYNLGAQGVIEVAKSIPTVEFAILKTQIPILVNRITIKTTIKFISLDMNWSVLWSSKFQDYENFL